MTTLHQSLAMELYHSYCRAVLWVSEDGSILPEWDVLFADPEKTRQVTAWLAVADEAILLLAH